MKDPVTIHVSEGSKGTTLAGPQTATQALSDSYSVPERLKQHVVVVPSKLHLVCLASFILAKCKVGNTCIRKHLLILIGKVTLTGF